MICRVARGWSFECACVFLTLHRSLAVVMETTTALLVVVVVVVVVVVAVVVVVVVVVVALAAEQEVALTVAVATKVSQEAQPQ
jgi:hypothetical protein